MEHVSTFFKEENDILYRIGEKDGIEKTKAEAVKSLLLDTDFAIVKIASLAKVTEAFVRKIKRGLKAKA